MKKSEAQAVADRYFLAIRVHYEAELENFRRIRTEAEEGVKKWLETKAYRKKGYDRPHVPSHRVQLDHSYYILRALEDVSPETRARAAVKNLLNGPLR